MILYVETNFLILICLICKNNKNLLINAIFLKILSVSRHFERNEVKSRNDEVRNVKMS